MSVDGKAAEKVFEDAEGPTFFGKYRGRVTNPVDALGMGRVEVSVTDVLGEPVWAMPCAPWAGPGVGFFAIPPEHAQVWVEFERGDPDRPIWTGGFWKLGEAPAPPGPQQSLARVIAGDNFSFEVLDLPGNPTLRLSLTTAAGEAEIKADATGMTLSWGKSTGKSTVVLSLEGVSINGSNLKVLP